MDIHSRTRLLLGDVTLKRLHETRVIIFGVGGVGSWCAEGLLRSGVRHLTLVDSDDVALSNCNRQLPATTDTIGRPKVEVMQERLLSIDPEAEIVAHYERYTPETANDFRLSSFDFVIDAIDSLDCKMDLILRATALPNTTLISSMGAARRIDPLQVRRAEFWKVQGDPLARSLRERFRRSKQLPQRKFTCIYSEEPPRQNCIPNADANGSLCPVTAAFGMAIAGEVIKQIARE